MLKGSLRRCNSADVSWHKAVGKNRSNEKILAVTETKTGAKTSHRLVKVIGGGEMGGRDASRSRGSSSVPF